MTDVSAYSRHGVGFQHPHLDQESLSGLLVSHFRMGFEKQKGCSMGKVGFDHSNLFLGFRQEIWVNTCPKYLSWLKGFKGSQM